MRGSDFSYRNLIVWQRAMQFLKVVYGLVERFPANEKFALSSQLRRSVVSIASNIAEGCGRISKNDYAHFLAIARGSLYESMTQLEMALSLNFIDSIADAEILAVEISRMLTTLIKKYTSLPLHPPTPTNPSHSH